MCSITIKECIENEVFHGCKALHRNPKMTKYVYKTINGVDIIDIRETILNEKAALAFLQKVSMDGGKILFVAPQKLVQGYIKNTAIRLYSPYATVKWIGGSLTNFVTIRKIIKRIEKNPEKNAASQFLSKKEIKIAKEKNAKAAKILEGFFEMYRLPAAIVVINAKKNITAIKEGISRGIGVVAIGDTNSDPTDIDYFIPANTSSLKSIRLIVDDMALAIQNGQKEYKKRYSVSTENNERSTTAQRKN